jgi:hypothetical protein
MAGPAARVTVGAAAKRHRPRMAAAYAAAALAFTYAAVSLYWAAGGTALLSTVGGSVAGIARQGGVPAVALGLTATALKLAGGILALALVRPWGRAVPRGWLLACAAGASMVLACYGAIQAAAGSLVLSGAVRPAAVVDWNALRWHVLVWDMWFLIWGIALAAATVTWWRHGSVRTGRKPGPAERPRRPRAGPGGDTPERARRVSTRAPR